MENNFQHLMNYVMSDVCYKKYFVKFDFLDMSCFKAVLSKLLGYGIVLGAVLVKVPQIQKILSSKSAVGLSFIGLLLEIFAVVSMVAYSLAKGFPFSSWGDAFFLLLQNILIGFLMQHYNGRNTIAVLFFVSMMGIIYVLTSGITPISVLTALQAINLPAVCAAKFIQALNNYRNGSTGQLSAITVFLTFSGSLARIFTSIQETGDNLIIITYALSTFFNMILVAQMIYYWRVPAKPKKD